MGWFWVVAKGDGFLVVVFFYDYYCFAFVETHGQSTRTSEDLYYYESNRSCGNVHKSAASHRRLERNPLGIRPNELVDSDSTAHGPFSKERIEIGKPKWS